MRSHLPRMLLALGLPVLCWTLSGCGGGDDAPITTGTAAPSDPTPVDSGDTSGEMPAGHEESPGAHDPMGGAHDETYADAGATDGAPGESGETAAPGGHDEGPLPGEDDMTTPEAAGIEPMPVAEAAPGAHDEGTLPGEAAPGEAPGEPLADGAHSETPGSEAPAGDAPADPMAVAGGEAPAEGTPGGELDPNGGTAATDKLPEVKEDSAAWPAVELIRRVRAGEADAAVKLLYPGQRRGLVGKLASEAFREEAVTEMKDLFSEIIPLDARQIDNNHIFTVLNSKKSTRIDFTVRRTRDGFVVYSISPREVSERDLRTMQQGAQNRQGGGAGGNTGGY